MLVAFKCSLFQSTNSSRLPNGPVFPSELPGTAAVGPARHVAGIRRATWRVGDSRRAVAATARLDGTRIDEERPALARRASGERGVGVGGHVRVVTHVYKAAGGGGRHEDRKR